MASPGRPGFKGLEARAFSGRHVYFFFRLVLEVEEVEEEEDAELQLLSVGEGGNSRVI